jgi:hypothetical protein
MPALPSRPERDGVDAAGSQDAMPGGGSAVSSWIKAGIASVGVFLVTAGAGYLLTSGSAPRAVTVQPPLRSAKTPVPRPTPTPVRRVASPRTSAGDFQAGMAFLAYTHDSAPPDTFSKLLDQLAGDDVNSLAITFPVYTDGPSSNLVHRGQYTPSDQYLMSLIEQAQARGFSTMLRPLLDESSLPPPLWRGQIEPSNRQAWFASYGALILDYARLAQKESVDSLGIGSELNSMELSVAAWRSLIGQVKQVYSGQVTYAFNWGSSFHTDFWPQLDFVSVDAYFPLDRTPVQATVAQMATDWRRWLDLVKRFDQPYGKPIVFTELGLVPKVGAQQKPWNPLLPGQFDLGVQRAYYEATCGATSGAVSGLYWWFVSPTTASNLTADDYNPLGRPAERSLQSCYAQAENLPPPSPASST